MIDLLLCQETKTLLDALKMINENGKGAVFIVNDQKKLRGILTDGDLRRLILNGAPLQELIINTIRSKPVYAKETDSQRAILKKLNDTIRILPVVNKNDVVVDFVEYKGDVHFPLIAPNLDGNEFKYLIDAFLSTWISSRGEYIEKFEKNFSKFCQTSYGVSTSNGTVALHLALLACGIGPGDEVIVPDLTFAATINAVLHAGATPVIVDIERSSWGIDPVEIEKAITRRTTAIIPVHLYGQPCDMGAIMRIAKKHKLFVIEDCAEAHGAEYDGRKVGSFGDVSCFSFYGNKVITTGEGGMCVTSNKRLDQRMRILRDHGMSVKKKYWHECVGYNYRMTNLQAAIGVAQLERIDEILDGRQRVESFYRKVLKDVDFVEFQKMDLPRRKKITWLVSLLIQNGQRDHMVEKLRVKNFDVRNFFFPLSSMAIYKKFKFSGRQSMEISRQGISLPSSPSISEEVVYKIANVLKAKNK